MKALITGVTGFAGGHLAEHLLETGDQVLGCSSSGRWPDWAGGAVRGGVPLVVWDFAGQSRPADRGLAQVVEFAPDCIYHLAALSVPDDCGHEQPTPRARAVNVEGTMRVLELAASLSPQPRVLFVSTSHVYSPVTTERPQVDETAPLGPRRGYGMTKLAAEEKVRIVGRDLQLDTLIVRAFQHTGPGQTAPMMLPQWASQFARDGGGPVRVKNREAWIDLSDVRDVVRAYRLLALHGEPGGTYNVGSGVNRRTGDILDLLAELCGSRRAVVESQPGLKQDPIADISRLAARTGWRPQIPLARTLADTLDYWRRRELHYVQAV
ncbi:MAG: NAD-dependent epimerase/dehydratase family protein [Pirellulales bacterium]